MLKSVCCATCRDEHGGRSKRLRSSRRDQARGTRNPSSTHEQVMRQCRRALMRKKHTCMTAPNMTEVTTSAAM
eukprot:scaffold94687_cov29-Tisochrysis_lutea.AAC.3